MSTKSSNTVKWIAISLGVAVLILLFLLFWQNSKLNDHKAGFDEQKKRADSAMVIAKRSDAKVDTMNKTLYQTRSERDSLTVQLSDTKTKLKHVVAKNMNLADQVKIAKSLKDTALYIVSCDSLVEENKNLYFVLNDYSVVVDSLMGVNNRSAAISDSIAAERAALNSYLRQSFNQSDSAYRALYKDYNKTVKKLKTQRVLTKGAAGLGIAAVILVSLLK